jgi:phenylacetate-CoA ligase
MQHADIEGGGMRSWLASHVWFPLQERLKGHETLRILREMEAADRMSAAELAQLQRDRLQTLIASSYRDVPYVRDQMQRAGLGPDDIGEPADLRKLPLLRKTDVRQNRSLLKSQTAKHLSGFTSGGSTGEPLIFDLGKTRIASRVACRLRVGRWWGVGIGDPEIALWGSPIELSRQDRIRRVRDRLLATRLLSAFEMTEQMMTEYVGIIAEGRWRQIFAYPSAIYVLCLHARKLRVDLRKSGVKVVFVTSEVLLPHQRQLITETLGCPVANGYGGRDSGFIAHECPEGGMHLMADAVITEIVDALGDPVPPGEMGDIVVTDLFSHEAPFLRYVTGDMGVSSTRQCSCGRSLPLLERIEGRSNDAVVTPDGRIMHGQSLVAGLMAIEGIEQFRICQKRLDAFHLQIVRNGSYHSEAAEEAVRARWTQMMRAPVQVTFEYVPRIAAEARGKFRHIVSELPEADRVRNSRLGEQSPMVGDSR